MSRPERTDGPPPANYRADVADCRQRELVLPTVRRNAVVAASPERSRAVTGTARRRSLIGACRPPATASAEDVRQRALEFGCLPAKLDLRQGPHGRTSDAGRLHRRRGTTLRASPVPVEAWAGRIPATSAVSLRSIMTKEDLRTPITGRQGAAEYQDLSRQLHRDRISLTRALEDRDTSSVIRESDADLDRALDRAIVYIGAGYAHRIRRRLCRCRRRSTMPRLRPGTASCGGFGTCDNACASGGGGGGGEGALTIRGAKWQARSGSRRQRQGPHLQGSGSRSTARPCRPATERAWTSRLRSTASPQRTGVHAANRVAPHGGRRGRADARGRAAR